jgi:glycerophosphoryl diester phosphodiesterase
MQYLAHRGFWLAAEEKNSERAIHRAFASGFGIETDVRDRAGTLVISHDPPSSDEMTFEHFIAIYLSYPTRSKLALNVKADGLQAQLKQDLEKAAIENYVVFDMSVPDLLGYRRQGIPFYVRRSEYEGASSLDTDAAGAWLDAFETPYASTGAIRTVAGEVKGDLALVSPELHGRPYLPAWEEWRAIDESLRDRICLCTDFPERARSFFSVEAAGRP